MFPGRKLGKNSSQPKVPLTEMEKTKEKKRMQKMLYVISIWEFSSLFSSGPWRFRVPSLGLSIFFANLFASPARCLLPAACSSCSVCLLIFYYYLRDFARGGGGGDGGGGMCMQINEKLQETKHGSCPGRKAGRKEARQRHSQTSWLEFGQGQGTRPGTVVLSGTKAGKRQI